MPKPSRREFEQLVREHHAAVLRAAGRVLGSADRAADVAQEVFLRVLRGGVRLAAARDHRAVLCWLATRLARNAGRAERRRARHEESIMNVAPEAVADPFHLAAAGEQRRTLAESVAALPRELRLPVCLRCEDGLAFAAIADALALPESTVHERFRRGVARLQQLLLGRGLALSAVDVSDWLAAAPVPPQPKLEAQLRGLAHGAVRVGSRVLRRAVLGAVAATAIVTTTLASPFGGEPSPGSAPALVAAQPGAPAAPSPALQDPPPVRRPAPAPPVPPPPEATPTPTVLAGSVRDAEGSAVAAVRVEAVAGGGLKAFALGDCATGDDGAFRLTLDPGRLGGLVQKLRLVVRDGGNTLLETGDLALPAKGEEAGPVALVLPPSAGVAGTHYDLAVTVRDCRGQALADVPVLVYASVPPPRPGFGSHEGSGRTAADGTVDLRGRTFGRKWVFVDGRAAGGAPTLVPCAIEAGRHALAVDVPAGHALAVELTTVDGSAPGTPTVWFEDAIGVQYPAKGTGGRLEVSGLAAGALALHVQGWPWSAVQRPAVAPAAGPVRVQLKRSDDAREVGDHMAELHGRLVDARSGEAIAFGGFAIATYAMGEGASSLATDCVDPPPPVQRASDGKKREVFHETGLAGGRHVVVVDVPEHALTAWTVELAAGQVRADVAIPLEAGATIAGRVLLQDGAPVANAPVVLIGVGERAERNLRAIEAGAARGGDRVAWPSLQLCRTWTKDDGSFTLHRVPPGVAVRVVAVAAGQPVVSAPNVHRAGEQIDGLVLRLPR